MTMMHLKYPLKRGYFSWDELGCLARALGFLQDMFYSHIPEEYTSLEPGVSLENMYEMIDKQKYFNQAVDRTSNIHTDVWNLLVIKRALPLLSSRVLTFAELQAVRVAYQLYETGDTKGLPIDDRLMLRTLKLCDRMISPLKMMHRVKHMRDHFEEAERIQLHEFLDLLLWCEMYREAKVGPPEMNVRKENTGLFQLENFQDVLAHHDQRVAHELDEKFIAQEFKFTKEKHGSKALPKDVAPIDPEVRKKQVAYHKSQHQFLQYEIASSQNRVGNAMAGYIRNRPITAPDLTMHEVIDPSMGVSTINPRPLTVLEAAGHLFRVTSRPVTREEVLNSFPRPSVAQYIQPMPPVIAHFGHVEDTMKSKEALHFEMETIDLKYQQILDEDLDFVMPGFKERQATRKIGTPTPPPKLRPPKEACPSKEVLLKLAYPKFARGPPPPSHAKTCDARFRGWHKSRTKKGPHHIVAKPTFDHSPNGTMLAKLRLASQNELGREDFISRITHPNQIVPDHPRPQAVQTMAEKLRPPRDYRDPLLETNSECSARTTGSKEDSERSCGVADSLVSETSQKPAGATEIKTSEVSNTSIDWEDFKMYQGAGEPDANKENKTMRESLEEKYKIVETYTQRGLEGYQKGKVMGHLNVLEQIQEGEEKEDEGIERERKFQKKSVLRTKTAPNHFVHTDDLKHEEKIETKVEKKVTLRTQTAPEMLVRPQMSRIVSAPELGCRSPDWVTLSPNDQPTRSLSTQSHTRPTSQISSRKSEHSLRERTLTLISPDNRTLLEGIPKAKDPEVNQWIQEILTKDFNDGSNRRRNSKAGLRRLSMRGQGVVSNDLRSKLIHGLS